MSTSEQTGPEAPTPQQRPAKRVSLQTVERLSVYRKVLEELDHDGVENIHSHELAELVGVTPAQLRRDLASFGTFGNISRGYNVYQMSRTISRILGTDETQTVALFGVGDLGRALLSYRGFEERGFHITVAFDVDGEKVGPRLRRPSLLPRRPPGDGAARVRRPHGDPRVPARGAADAGRPRRARAGVHAVLNFVPKRVGVPDGCLVEESDITSKLEMLSFLAHDRRGRGGASSLEPGEPAEGMTA